MFLARSKITGIGSNSARDGIHVHYFQSPQFNMPHPTLPPPLRSSHIRNLVRHNVNKELRLERRLASLRKSTFYTDSNELFFRTFSINGVDAHRDLGYFD